MTDLSTVSKREKLIERREPYWCNIGAHAYLGYRCWGAGRTWLVRLYRPMAAKRQTYRSLGDLAGYIPSTQFDVARRLATEWLGHVGAGGSTENVTVGEICLRYLESRAEESGKAAVQDHLKRLERFVFSSAVPLADIPLTKLTNAHVLEWRKYVQRLPALVTRRAADNETRKRSPSTLNRDMVPLRAALNFGLKNGHVLSDIAWRNALTPIKNADRRRDLYLDRKQRQALIEKLPKDLATFASALCFLPLRPGALAKLTGRNFDARKHELHVPSDKAGGDRRLLLPEKTSKFFAKLTRLKTPNAPLFAQVDGKAWNKDAWKRPIKAAAAEAKLPAEVTAYSLRHSTITDLVTGGLDLLTIAQISGTSAAMIEKHYGHLQKKHAADALAALAF